MSNKFAEDLMIRLAEYSKGPSTSTPQDKVTAQLAPLHTRLKKLLDTLPLSEQNKGLSLLGIQARLRGRKKNGLAHVGELGAALRRLGWHRRRAWSDEATSFASLWYPKKPN